MKWRTSSCQAATQYKWKPQSLTEPLVKDLLPCRGYLIQPLEKEKSRKENTPLLCVVYINS